MKMASFLLISVAFHAAILTLPVSFFEAGIERVIPVSLYGLGEGDGQGPGGIGNLEGGNPKPSSGPNKRKHYSGKQQARNENETNPPAEVSAQVNLFTESMADEGLMVAGSTWTGMEGAGDISNEAGAEGIGGEESKGKGGNTGTGMGSGGSGGGISSGVVFARANYAHNPWPVYPEQARREGWEGTVILRVLVDQEGRSKWIEVSRSSGFVILDGAAVETVKRWRFHPARYGDRRVESWVKVPIIFRLANLKN